MDYGEEGLLDTMVHLDQAGIRYIGAGHDRDEAFKPLIIEKKGMKIAFLGFSRIVPDNSWNAGAHHPGVADTYDYTMPVKAIQQARSQADLVVIMTHWGIERQNIPAAYQTDLAHRYIDAGADLIVGGHPHVLQGFEAYKGKWIAYSMGNFIFTTNNVEETLETMILNASCSKDRKCSISAIPIYTSYAKPVKMNEEQGLKLFERISAVSIHSQIKRDGSIVEQP
jgi:poly-gamma-glutamate synthesis protein (capsule biosynthesis protein)